MSGERRRGGSQYLEALIMEDDPLIEAFIEDVLLTYNIASDCISLPERFVYLLRRPYDVAVIGISTQSYYLRLSCHVLRRRRIPITLFSTDPQTVIDPSFSGFPISYYDRAFPDRLAHDVIRLASCEDICQSD